MFGRTTVIERGWSDASDVLLAPRTDLLREVQIDEVGLPRHTVRFRQQHGPFTHYARTVTAQDDTNSGRPRRDAEQPTAWVERIEYQYRLPGFGWLVAGPIRYQLARRGRNRPSYGPARPPWWAPPDVLDARQLSIFGLLICATVAAAYMNSLFSQTSSFAAQSFGASPKTLGSGLAIVRLGIVLSLPLAIAADRVGRRRVLIFTAFAAPLFCALGALAPNFAVLVATQTLGRPLAITLDMVLAVVAAEEMPKSSRAYTVAVMAMAYGLGAGLVVMGLPLADLGDQWWRADYVAALAWIGVGLVFVRMLPESKRFVAPHVRTPPVNWRRLVLVSAAVIAGNFFVAPTASFLNHYLSEVRGLSATAVALFSLSVGTPAGVGLVIGGKLADRRGRRSVIIAALPVSTALLIASYNVAGFAMWWTFFLGSVVAGIAAPALLVYRSELFPTGKRGFAAGMVNVAALSAGSLAIWAVGNAVDAHTSFGTAIAWCGIGQLAVVVLVAAFFPESANTELEDLNEIDEVIAISNL